jgi:hypothetical protein
MMVEDLASDTFKGDPGMRDVRKFLMAGSVIRVDEGETIAIQELAVMLHTDDPDRNGYPETPCIIGVGPLKAAKKTYIYMHVDHSAPVAEVPDDLQEMMLASTANNPYAHSGLRNRGRLTSHSGSLSSPALDYIHEHGAGEMNLWSFVKLTTQNDMEVFPGFGATWSVLRKLRC